MAAGRANGGWPELDPHTPPGGGDFPSAWRRIVEVLDQIKGVVASAQGEARMANQNSGLLLGQMRSLNEKFDGVVKVMANIPPARPPLDSTHAALERKASDSFGEQLQKMASESPGPSDHVLASPGVIRRLADQVWAEKAREAKHEADAKRLQEMDDARKQSARDLHALKMHGLKVILGVVIVAVLGIAGAYFKGRGDTPAAPPATTTQH